MNKKTRFALVIVTSVVIIFTFHVLAPEAKAPTNPEAKISGVLTIQGDSLAAYSPLPDPKVERTMQGIITAYSSSVDETDDNPFITASGAEVHDGIIANNLLPFGTKVRLPEVYGDKIFTVEDRMNSRKSDYQFDIWFPSKQSALDFGAKNTEVQILGI